MQKIIVKMRAGAAQKALKDKDDIMKEYKIIREFVKKYNTYTYCISRRNFCGGMHLRVR
jgi:hypothetical protein